MDKQAFSSVVPGHTGVTAVWTCFTAAPASTVCIEGSVNEDTDTSRSATFSLSLDSGRVFVRSIANEGNRRGLVAAVIPMLIKWCLTTGRVTATAPITLGAAGWLNSSGHTFNRIPLARYYARIWGMHGKYLDIWSTRFSLHREIDMETTVEELLKYVARPPAEKTGHAPRDVPTPASSGMLCGITALWCGV